MNKKKEKKQNLKKISFFMKIMISLRTIINNLIKMINKTIGAIYIKKRKKMMINMIITMIVKKINMMNFIISKTKMKIMMI